MSQESDIQDPYEILQVHPKADMDTIKYIYLYLVRKYHPDKAPLELKVDYAERMKTINAAFDFISNPNNKNQIFQKSHNNLSSSEKNNCRFEIADALLQAAIAGGGRNECCRRAISILQSIVTENQGSELEYKALDKIADIQFNHLHDYPEAAVTFDRMSERTPKGSDLDNILHMIIECNSRAANYPEALNSCERTIQNCTLTETKVYAYLKKGDLLDSLRRFNEAVDVFKNVVLTYPNTEEAAYAQYRLARILDSGMQKYTKAMDEYRKVLKDYRNFQWANDCQWRIDYIQRKYIEKKGWWE